MDRLPENILSAQTGDELIQFINETKTKSNYELKEIALSEQEQWSILQGVLSHKSRGFFQVMGLKNRINPSDEKLMLYQPQSALTGLIFFKSGDEIYTLLQARVEPGNSGIIQLGPTIQSTPANYLQLHGGKATAYVENFTSFYPGCHLIWHSMQHDLGSKYYQKSKTHHYLLSTGPIATEENMVWASLSSIQDVLLKDNLLNADLRSLLAVFDWDGFWQNGNNSSVNITVPEGDLSKLKKYEMTPLEDLKKWEVNSQGVKALEGQASSVGMFHFSATNREVKAWSQPLYKVEGQGLVQLLYTQESGELNFLVRFDHECGISTPIALYPSYLSTPEDPNPESPFQVGETKYEIIQCDEGGRFFRNNSTYQVIQVEKKVPDTKGIWITSLELRAYLNASNICSFQLRCISSLVLHLLHPLSFDKK
ncbi:NDP-hexose 2,3-dehydratase family protein [Algoriphagus sediminis]|uniref:NDP-hexose 2,3-dehydratase family protein n=1 Tax=Algoriphagus sediminis TaxID=3057113 RepID=A0ABT7YGE8_9BACT|nr:NDP-hexose 2,3-dehydratase family protein [Algoriphagus sediminis]MDN3205572.1 NDP-hexose 2,3-dehydratase family protein [Algoriphagus sediminis]